MALQSLLEERKERGRRDESEEEKSAILIISKVDIYCVVLSCQKTVPMSINISYKNAFYRLDFTMVEEGGLGSHYRAFSSLSISCLRNITSKLDKVGT